MKEEAFRTFLTSTMTRTSKIFAPLEIMDVLMAVKPTIEESASNKLTYLDIPASFDIETSSFYRGSGKHREKCACMYEWTLGIGGLVIVGREWHDFVEICRIISAVLELGQKRRLVIFVHNLSYEFQFMRKWFRWPTVFAIDTRKPLYAVTDLGIEFRCSYLLSGYSLESLGEQLHRFPVKKLVGYLDYSKIRHSTTPLTEDELSYCVNDVLVVMAYIAELILRDGGIARLPLTKTGYVRRFCRNMCFYEGGDPSVESFKALRYRSLMAGMTLEPDEYQQLVRAFQGGFTHANPFFSGRLVEDVTSYDFTSSYPCVMVAEQFPMSRAQIVRPRSREEFERNLKCYCCLFDVEFEGLMSKVWIDSYLSLSRCWEVEEAVVNNGRVVSAARLRTTITEQDFMIIRKWYSWEHMRIGTFRRYKKDYLPTDFVLAILSLYHDKTTLKGVEGKEVEYLNSKEMLNSCYGMAVTSVIRDEHGYAGDEWLDPKKPDIKAAIIRYNKNGGRFLFYPWGVWVTAYARRNLFSGIVEFGDDYVYSDTDSIKARHAERHAAYIEDYNERITRQLRRAMNYHALPHSLIAPLTKEGVPKPLGVWDFDGHYSKFKTLGAKRYLVQYSQDERNKKKDRGKISLTVSGLNKQTCVPYLNRNGRAFDEFVDELYIPPEYTGKNTHTYIDAERTGTVTDYLGVEAPFRELSSVHMEAADYSLSISREYADFLRNIREDIT